MWGLNAAASKCVRHIAIISHGWPITLALLQIHAEIGRLESLTGWNRCVVGLATDLGSTLINSLVICKPGDGSLIWLYPYEMGWNPQRKRHATPHPGATTCCCTSSCAPRSWRCRARCSLDTTPRCPCLGGLNGGGGVMPWLWSPGETRRLWAVFHRI